MNHARSMVLAGVALMAVVVGAVGCAQKPMERGHGGQPGAGGLPGLPGQGGQGGDDGGSGQAGADGGILPPIDGPTPTLDPGTAVSLTVPPARTAALTQAKTMLDADVPANAAEFASHWKPSHIPTLGYDPLQAKGIDLLAASHLVLNDGEGRQRAQHGGVVINEDEGHGTHVRRR